MVAVVMEQAVERLVSIREHVVCELVVFVIACPVELWMQCDKHFIWKKFLSSLLRKFEPENFPEGYSVKLSSSRDVRFN